MKWFKLDSGFTLDGKVLKLDNRQFRAWMSIMSLISSKYTGSETEFECELNSFLMSSKLLQKSLEMVLNTFINEFKIGYKLFINENKIVFTYDKFLIKQKKYFRGVCKKTKSVTIDKEEDKEEDKDIKIYKKENLESINILVDYYKSKINNNINLTKTSKLKIKTRLKNYSVEKLKEAIDKFSSNTWRMENNSDKGLSWFFRSDAQIDTFLELIDTNRKSKQDFIKEKIEKERLNYDRQLDNF